MTTHRLPRIVIDAWLVVLVIDRISYTDDATHPVAVVSLACALWALLTRSDRFAVAALIGDAVAIGLHAPDVANHLTLLFFVDLLIAGALIRPAGIDARLVTAMIRTMVIGVYVAAALHKLNSSYLDPVTSCAVSVFERTAFDVSLPTGVGWVVLVVSLVVELGLAVMLVSRRLRRAGLIGGLVFHGVLALAPIGGVASFSVFMAASYLVFFPTDALERLEQLRSRIIGPLRSAPWVVAVPFVLTALITLVNLYLPGLNLLGVRFAGVLILFGLLLFTLRFPADLRLEPFPRSAGALVGASAILIFLSVSTLAPYVGARTQLSFSMFSNLRTETSPNHVFMPQIDVFDTQGDLVSVVRAPSPDFDPITGPGLVVPAYEVGRRLALNEEVDSITVLENGVEMTYEAGALRERFPEPGSVSGRLFRMRATELTGPVSCRH